MTRRRSTILASSRPLGDGANRDRCAGVAAALAISIVAFAAPTASAADDWAAAVGGGADAQLAKRLEADVRILPGTDTRYLVGGYLELDGLATRKKQTGDEQDTFLVSATPFGSADSDRRLSVRQSQINWLSYTPTGLGTITARAEATFSPSISTARPGLSLQQLYVRIADALVVGRTYSTFVDADVLPTTLDYNGPSGETAVQQWLARATIPLGAGWTIAGGIEDSQAEDHAGGAFAVCARTPAGRISPPTFDTTSSVATCRSPRCRGASR